MSAVAKLTPQARKERAKRGLAEAVAELVTATIEEGLAASEWVDQRASPLGQRPHLELARSGKVPSRKIVGRVLIRRDDLNRYIEQEGLQRGARADEEDVTDIVEAIVSGSSRR